MHKALLALTLGLGLFPLLTPADPGVFPDRIVLGQSAPLEGAARALGQGMRLGLEAAFQEANRNGGVKGRRLELISLDDGYEPERAVANAHRLIRTDQVFALVGGVGTPTAKATLPIAQSLAVPFIGPFTGAGFLRDPAHDQVINLRGSYDQETEAWIDHLTRDLGARRIAILYQDDSFGLAGLSGVQKALAARNLELVAEGVYRRNTTAVKTALLTLRKARPDAVVMVGAYQPLARFVTLARELGLKVPFVTLSFVGSRALAGELGEQGAGVVVSQVVPSPFDPALPLVADYQAALAGVDDSAPADFVSLEGYLVGRLLVAALERIDGEPTRRGLLETFARVGRFDLGGVVLAFGPGDNQGMDQVYLSMLQPDGGFRYVDRLTKP